jgi:hypothetical protein
MQRLAKKVAWICLLLTIWSVFAIAAHHHSSATEAARCAVCIAVHAAFPQINSARLNIEFVPVATLKLEPLSAKRFLPAFALSIRPPPIV